MKFLCGHAFDAWNNLRFAFSEWGKAIERAMDCWGDDDE